MLRLQSQEADTSIPAVIVVSLAAGIIRKTGDVFHRELDCKRRAAPEPRACLMWSSPRCEDQA